MARRSKAQSEYKKQLVEKQELKKIYGIREKQMKRYFTMAKKMPGNLAINIFTLLERRLDNTIYRAGFAKTRRQARQYSAHGLFLLNQKRAYTPSILIKNEQLIEPRKPEQFAEKQIELRAKWLKKEGDKIIINSLPGEDDYDIPIDMSLVIQFYSR